MKQTTDRLSVWVLWLFCLVAPVLLLCALADTYRERAETAWRFRLQRELRAEMTDFQHNLMLQKVLADRLTQIAGSLHYQSFRDIDSSRNTPDPGINGAHRVKQAIATQLGWQPRLLTVFGPDCRDVWMLHTPNDAGITGDLATTTMTQTIINWYQQELRIPVAYPDFVRQLPKTRNTEENKQHDQMLAVLVDGRIPASSSGTDVRTYLSTQDGSILYCFRCCAMEAVLQPSAEELRFPQKTRNHGGVVVVFAEREIPPDDFLQQAIRKGDQNRFFRTILTPAQASQPEKMAPKDHFQLTEEIPLVTQLFLSRNIERLADPIFAAAIHRGEQLLMRVSVNTEAGVPLERLLFHIVLATSILTCLLPGVWIGLTQAGKLRWQPGLQAKIAIIVALACLVPLAGSVLASYGLASAEQDILRENLLNEMDFRIKLFQQGLDGYQTLIARDLRQVAEQLSGKIEETVAKGADLLTKWSRESFPKDRELLQRTQDLFLTNRNNSDVMLFNDGCGEGYRNSRDKSYALSRVLGRISLLAFARQGMSLPTQVRKKYEDGLAVMQAMVDEKLFSLQLLHEMLAKGLAFSPAPMTTSKDVVAILPIWNTAQDLVEGILVATLQLEHRLMRYVDELRRCQHPLIFARDGHLVHLALYRLTKAAGTTPAAIFDPPPEYRLALQRFASLSDNLHKDLELSLPDAPTPVLAMSRIVNECELMIVAFAIPAQLESTITAAAATATASALASFSASASFLPLILPLLYGVLLVLLLAKVAAGQVTQPVRVLAEAAKATADGNYSWNIVVSGHDEFSQLARSFNTLVRGLFEREQLSRFVSAEVVSMARSESDTADLQPQGETITATVLFTHLHNFAELCRQHPAEDIVPFLNDLFSVLEPCILNNRGSIDKFIGDSLMAVFRPSDGIDHAARGATAALALQKKLRQFNADRHRQGLFCSNMGIGLATGPVISGRMGSFIGRLDFTVIGNTVNLAARLLQESRLARQTGIIVAPGTISAARGHLRITFLTRTPIKGRSRTFPLYELLGTRVANISPQH